MVLLWCCCGVAVVDVLLTCAAKRGSTFLKSISEGTGSNIIEMASIELNVDKMVRVLGGARQTPSKGGPSETTWFEEINGALNPSSKEREKNIACYCLHSD